MANTTPTAGGATATTDSTEEGGAIVRCHLSSKIYLMILLGAVILLLAGSGDTVLAVVRWKLRINPPLGPSGPPRVIRGRMRTFTRRPGMVDTVLAADDGS